MKLATLSRGDARKAAGAPRSARSLPSHLFRRGWSSPASSSPTSGSGAISTTRSGASSSRSSQKPVQLPPASPLGQPPCPSLFRRMGWVSSSHSVDPLLSATLSRLQPEDDGIVRPQGWNRARPSLPGGPPFACTTDPRPEQLRPCRMPGRRGRILAGQMQGHRQRCRTNSPLCCPNW